MFTTPLRNRKVRQQISPFPHANIFQMRQGGTETATGLFKCRGVKCTLACKRQMMDQSPPISERTRFEEMVRDVSGALVNGTGIEPLDRVGDAGMQ
jgi:hypothetical protein